MMLLLEVGDCIKFVEVNKVEGVKNAILSIWRWIICYLMNWFEYGWSYLELLFCLSLRMDVSVFDLEY